MSEHSLSTRRAHLALAGQNSGAGWLANLLLELDIPITPPGAESELPAWQACAGGWSLAPHAFRHMRGVLPAVHRRTVFSFPDDLEVCVESDHAAALGSGDGPTIVVLRDPRDAFPGQWERGGTGTATLDDFLAHAGDNPLALPPPEAWAVRALLWDALATLRPILVVRYENLRADTAREARRVLDFLGIARSDAAIAQAVTLSTFERSQATLAQAARAAGAVASYPGRGRSGDWPVRLSAAQQARFGGLAGCALQQAGYPAAERRWEAGGGFAALRAQAPPGAQTVLGRAQSDMAGGNFGAALHRLASSISAVPGQDDNDAPLLSILTALRWTTALFPNAPDNSRGVPCAFNLFCDIHRTFGDAPWVRIAQMQALTAYAPRHAGAYNIWGKLLHSLNRPADAEQVFDAACTVGAESALLRSNLAVIAWQDGRRDLALAQISRAAQLDPHEPGVAANLQAMQSVLRAA